MIDIKRIKSLLADLRRRVRELEINFKPLPEEKLITDETIYAASERHLQIAIQAVLDISNHLITSMNLEIPRKENKEAVLVLGKEKIIPYEFAKKLTKMIGFRNILVHHYIDVERHNTYLNIQDNLGDFAEFAKFIEEFLQKHSNI